MRANLRKYMTTIVGFLVTVGLSLFSDFILQLPVEFTWLTFFVGSIVTISVTLLEQSILEAQSEELNRKLEIYELLEKIDDPELRKIGKETLEKCRIDLKNLSSGILVLETSQLHRYLISITNQAAHSLKATQIIPSDVVLGRLIILTREKPWYQQNIKLVKQGLDVHRLFIISKDKAISDETGEIKSELIMLLKMQQEDGIDVKLVWQDELEEPDLIQDFGLIDGQIAVVTSPAWSDLYGKVTVYRNQHDVSRYNRIYETLQAKSRDLADLTKRKDG